MNGWECFYCGSRNSRDWWRCAFCNAPKREPRFYGERNYNLGDDWWHAQPYFVKGGASGEEKAQVYYY